MSETKAITCIVCPRGCALAVTLVGTGAAVSGHACPKGETYGTQEAVQPMRSLTSTVRTDNPSRPRLPVRTDGEIPLAKLLSAMAVIDPIAAKAPVLHGDVLVKNLLGLGVNLIATDDLPAMGERHGT